MPLGGANSGLIGSRSSSALTRRRNARICSLLSSSRAVVKIGRRLPAEMETRPSPARGVAASANYVDDRSIGEAVGGARLYPDLRGEGAVRGAEGTVSHAVASNGGHRPVKSIEVNLGCEPNATGPTEDFTVFNRTPVSGSRSTRLSMSLAAGALMLLVTATGVVAGGGDQSTSSTGTSPSPGGFKATRVSPDPSVIDLHRTAWDHVKVSPNGKRLVVYFWMGVQDCYGLGRGGRRQQVRPGQDQALHWLSTGRERRGMHRDRPALQDSDPPGSPHLHERHPLSD